MIELADSIPTNQWSRVKDLFDRAVQAKDEDIDAMLDRCCAGEPALRASVEALLQLDDATTSWLRRPIDKAAEQVSEPPEAWIGRTLGRYRLTESIGTGGMGTVFGAERVDGEFEQTVAVKVVNRGLLTEGLKRRFLVERQILARLQHPNIARLLDGGTSERGVPYLVMERIDGRPITDYAGDLPLDQQIRLMIQACGAIEFAHSRLVVHRDLKPSNLLAGADGEVKLLDFGIAKLLNPAEDAEETAAGVQPLTPAYAAPEQILGGAVGTTTDVFSFGVVLYELVTGQWPFVGADRGVQATLRRKGYPPPRASEVVVGSDRHGRALRLRDGLDQILAKALAWDPSERYGSIAALGDDLERWLRYEPVSAVPPSRLYVMRKLIQRRRGTVVSAALLLLTLTGGFVARGLEADRANREADSARQARLESDAVGGFLSEMLISVDPAGSRGRDTQVVEVLAAASDGLSGRYPEVPAVEGKLRSILGESYLALHQFQESKDEYLAGLDVMLRAGTPLSDPIHLDLRLGLARAYNRLGLHQQVLELVEGNLEALVAEGGTPDVQILELRQYQGVAKFWLGDLEGARRILLEAADGYVLALGPAAPERFDLLLNLVVFHNNLSQWAQGEEVGRMALDECERRLGPLDEHCLLLGGALTVPLRFLGRTEEAIELGRRLVESYRSLGPDFELQVAEQLYMLSSSLELHGDLQAAEKALRESLETNGRLAGEKTEFYLRPQMNLGHVLELQGRLDEALVHSQGAVDGFRSMFNDRHYLVLYAEMRLARVLTRLGRHGRAESLLLGIEERGEGVQGGDVPTAARAHLGWLRLHEGRFDEAETLLLESYQQLAAAEGAQGRLAQVALEYLLDFYRRTGNAEQTARYELLLRR